MRVLMVTSGPLPTPGEAVTTNFIQRQADHLRAVGVTVDDFAFVGRQAVHRYALAWGRVQRKLASGSYDLVHAQFGHSGVVTFPKRLPLVVTLRGDDLQGLIEDEQGRIGFRGRLLQGISRWVACHADAVIVVSDHMRALLPCNKPVYTIPSGLDFELFRIMPRDEARRHLGLPLDRPLVLFAGRPHEPRKRYGLASRAVELLNGSVTPFAELIVAWGVPFAEMPYYMNACDALLFTSVQEGSPNVVKEALSCNLPVVSVPVGDVPLRLKGVRGCEIADESPEALAAALARVLRRAERSEGRAAVQELSESLLVHKVLEVYRSVLAA